MPGRQHSWITYVLTAVVAIATMRMVMVQGTSSIRWRVQWETFVPLALGTLSIESPPLGERYPSEQAQYWLRQTENLNSDSDPELIAGGAWVLSNPDTRFWRNFVRRNPDLLSGSGIPIGMTFQLDSESIAEATRQFHELARNRCVELSDLRVRLEPDNIEAWRMRALLAFEHDGVGNELKPRRADWEAVLSECEQHDPTNSLYAFLAANQCWNESAKREWRGNADLKDTLLVHNDARFEDGVRHLNAGLQKAELSFDTSHNAALFRFLDVSDADVTDRVEHVGCLSVGHYIRGSLLELYRWKQAKLNQHVASGNVVAAENTFLEIEAMFDHLSRSDRSLDLRIMSLQLKRSAYATYREFVDQHTPFVTAIDRATVQHHLDNARRDSEVLNRAIAKVNEQVADKVPVSQKPQPFNGEFAIALLMIVVSTTASLLFLSPIMTGLLAAAGRLCGKGQLGTSPPSWLTPHLASWLMSLCLTSIALGMFPARIISATGQSRVLLSLCGLCVAIGIAMLMSALSRYTAIKHRTLTAHLFGATLLLSTIAIWPDAVDFAMRLFVKLHPIASIAGGALFIWLAYTGVGSALRFFKSPQTTRHAKVVAATVTLSTATLLATGLGILRANGLPNLDLFQPIAGQEADRMGLSADGIKELMNVDPTSLIWVFLQWFAHGGPIVTAIMAFAISIGWMLSRSKPPHDLLNTGPFPWRSRIATTCSIHARYALHLSLAVLAATLFLLPATVNKPLTRYEHWRAVLEDPEQTQQRVDLLILQIRSDPAAMTEIETEINKWNESYANQLSAELDWTEEIADEEGYGDGPIQNAAE